MKKFLTILLAITLMACSQTKPQGKQIHPKSIDYELPYEDTSFNIKKIEFFYDEYNYAYIHYVRLWLDLSKMDDKTLRWFLDGFDENSKITPLVSLYDYPKYFSIGSYQTFRLIHKDYDEKNKELFYVYAGEPEKTIKTSFDFYFMLKAGSYFNSKDDFGNYYDFYYFKFSENDIPFQYYDLSKEQELRKAFRSLNSTWY